MDNLGVVECKCDDGNLNRSVSLLFTISIKVQARELSVARLHFIFHIRSKLTYLRNRISLIQVLFLEVLIHLWMNFEF